MSNLNFILGIVNAGDSCTLKASCGHYSAQPKLNHCNPKKCLESRLKIINSTVGDN